MTETRPDAGASSVTDGPPERLPFDLQDAVVDTADHKRIGLTYLCLALVSFLVVRAIGSALGAELTASGVEVVGDESRRLYGLYESGLVLLFLGPIWAGLATYLLPLQIGASRLAFPRLQALALWTTVGGAILFVAGHLVDPPPGIGLSDTTPLRAPVGGIADGTDLLLGGLVLLGLGALVCAGNLLATALVLRTDGMTLGRMPLFTWSVVASAAGLLIAGPVFLAGTLLLHLDLHFGGTSLFGPGKGPLLVWQKSLWLYGRPEIFLLALPGLGAACDMVATAARRGIADPPTPPVPASLARRLPPMPGLTTPLKGHVLAIGALCAAAGISFLTWAQDIQTLDALTLPTATVGTTLIALPVVLLLLLWAGTLGTARAKPTFAFAFVVAAVLVWAAAAANAIVAAIAGVEGSAFRSGQIELVAIGAPTLLAFGALHHWSPKLFGTRLSPLAGTIVLLAALGGTLALGLGQSIAGYAGAAAHLKDVTGGDAATGFRIAQLGHVLLLVAGVTLGIDVVRATATGRRADPTPADLEEGVTLEWATSSPPSPANFDEVPEVRSEAPLLDLRTATEGKE